MATILLALFAAMIAACGSPVATPVPTPTPPATSAAPASTPAPPLGTLLLERVLPEVRSPTNFIQSTDGLFVVTEQAGRLWTLDEDQLGAEHIFVPAGMDITGRVSSRGSEEGLLGLALDPNNRRHLYVYYSAANPRRSVVSRFNYGNIASPETELNQYQGGMCISGRLTMPERTPRHLISTLGPNRVGTDSAV